MSEHTGFSPTSRVSVEGLVIRCTCTDRQKQDPAWHGFRSEPCPNGRTEDLGTIAFWHRNPLRRWAWRINQALRGKRAGSIKTGA